MIIVEMKLIDAHTGKMWKHGKIKSFPRSGNLSGWDLLLRGLRAALGSRNNCFSDAEAGPGPDSDLVDMVRDVRSAQRRYFKSRSSDDLATSKRLEAILDEALNADAKQPGDSLFNAETAPGSVKPGHAQ